MCFFPMWKSDSEFLSLMIPASSERLPAYPELFVKWGCPMFKAKVIHKLFQDIEKHRGLRGPTVHPVLPKIANGIQGLLKNRLRILLSNFTRGTRVERTMESHRCVGLWSQPVDLSKSHRITQNRSESVYVHKSICSIEKYWTTRQVV